MKNRYFGWIFALVLVGALLVHNRHKDEALQKVGLPAQSSPPAFPKPLERQQLVPPSPSQVEIRTSAPPAAQQSPPNHQPPRGLVEFQIVDGWAVAFGDVLLGKPEAPGSETKKNGYYEAPTPQLWDKPEIPYAINPELPNPKRVENALQYLAAHTPVRFVPYQGQRDALVFEPGEKHCYSYLGKMGGLQPIRLAPGCTSQEILHEVMHALGFVHEQSRTDRDEYVEILWKHIDKQYQSQFAKVPDTLMETERDSVFDYHSIMIYSPNAFATSENLITLQSARAQEKVSPVQDGLSESDIQRLKRMYPSYEH